MGNMAYVRFTNTLEDLRNCEEHMTDSLSNKEHENRQRLVDLCKRIAEDYEDYDFDEENEEDEEEEEE